MDSLIGPSKEFPDIRPFVIGGVNPDHMDQLDVGAALLDLGQKLHALSTISDYGYDKRYVEGFKVERAIDVCPPAPCDGCHGRI
jgi:hypothetical protein